jgi:hypothetical protein
MKDLSPSGHSEEDRLAQYLVARYDAPAYVRRARRVEESLEQLVAQCQRKREEWLKPVRSSLDQLCSQVPGWALLRSWLSDDHQVGVLLLLQESVGSRKAFRPDGPTSTRRLGGALRALCEQVQHFNRRWNDYLCSLDLTGVNEVRDGYNRWYILEKECALRSASLARRGFTRLAMLTTADLALRLPCLPVPQFV